MEVIVSSEILDSDGWERLIYKSRFVHPLQSPAYHRIFGKLRNAEVSTLLFLLYSYGEVKASVVVTLFDKKSVLGFLSRRGIIFGGPVFSNDINHEELNFFLKETVFKLRGRVIYLETRNSFDYCDYMESFKASGWDYLPYINYQLSLQVIVKEAIPSLFKYNRRREVKLSIAEGLSYGKCENEKDFDELYLLLLDLYESRVKRPLPSIEYFRQLYQNDLMRVFIVKHNEKLLGGAYCLVQPGRALYTYYYCGIRDYHRRIYPTHLAILAAMEYALDNNIPLIDFMGAGKPDEEYGVRRYKAEFGGQLVEHGRFIKILNPFLYHLGRIGVKLISKV